MQGKAATQPKNLASRPDFGTGKAQAIFRNATNGQNQYWTMNGTVVVFRDFFVSCCVGWSMAGIADFNGDGVEDILWHNPDGRNYVWLIHQSGLAGTQGQDYGTALLPTLDPGWSVAGVGDLNGDGRADIVFHHTTGQNYVWFMNGSEITSQGSLPTISDTGWSIAGVADFNRDDKADILWSHTDGRKYMWLLDGLTVTVQAFLPTIDPGWSVAGVRDFNADRRTDILLRHTSGQNYLWFMNGTDISSQGALPSFSGSGWSLGEVADFSGDGKADIWWRNSDGRNYVWLVDGLNVTSQTLVFTLDNSWQLVNPK